MSGRRPDAFSDELLERVAALLSGDEPARQLLPVWGRLHIDRLLPFLCVYRRPRENAEPGLQRLIIGEASYVLAADEPRLRGGLGALVRGVLEAAVAACGAFLILEIWAAPRPGGKKARRSGPEKLPPRPRFRIRAPGDPRLVVTVAALEGALERIAIHERPAKVTTAWGAPPHPPGIPALLPAPEVAEIGGHWLGVEVQPIWLADGDGEAYPVVRRLLARRFAQALKLAFFEFARTETRERPGHHHTLGRRAVVRAVWEIDRRLAEIDRSFDPLLLMTPVNADAAWRELGRSGREREPRFLYRPLPVDPDLLKRRLHDIRIERVEDPTLAFILRAKRNQLDRSISMLMGRGTPSALYSSLQLHGRVEPPLLKLARSLLRKIAPRSRERSPENAVDAAAFAREARRMIAGYRKRCPGFTAAVAVRDDIGPTLMVSQGDLLVGERVEIPRSRVEALIAHEVETHVLTFLNGRSQPLQLLSTGLRGYEELQEGLAVLAEHLVGGLSRPRLRLLAARVLAAHLIVEGASFVETFRLLCRKHGFGRRVAYTVTMRVYRGGGLVKDAVYLRGLVGLLDHLGSGGELDPLFSGKISAVDVPLLLELQRRGVLHEPPLRPSYLDRPGVAGRLEGVRQGITVMELLKKR